MLVSCFETFIPKNLYSFWMNDELEDTFLGFRNYSFERGRYMDECLAVTALMQPLFEPEPAGL